jgi:hypothetical protein
MRLKKHIGLQTNITQNYLWIVTELNKYILEKERSSARASVDCIKDTKKEK